MKHERSPMRCSVLYCTIAILLSGCAATTTLLDGQPSAMTAADNSMRVQLNITQERATLPAYRPVRKCLFKESQISLDGKETEISSQLSVRNVKERLLFVFKSNMDTSTAIVSKTGKIYDFNVINQINKRRENVENYTNNVNQTVAKLNSKNDPNVSNAHVINDFSLKFPDHKITELSHGDIVSFIFDEDENIWGKYRFRGTSIFAGKKTAVLDLLHIFQSAPQIGEVVVGFGVFDLQTSLPLLVVLDAGFHYKLEQVSCSSQ